jgi:putative tryptophan/tyrosine transport system substrate-binding protein
VFIGYVLWHTHCHIRSRRKQIIACLVTVFLLVPLTLPEAQQPKKVPRVAYLTGGSLSAILERTDAFRRALCDLSYVEGKNITIEWRGADGNRDRQRALASELARFKVDVIVAASGGDTRAAKEATTTIPIVMTQADDPVGSGFVGSLARPGGNITGLSTLSPETSGKRLELLKEIVPKLSRVAVFGISSSPGNAHVLKEIEIAAGAFGVRPQYVDVLTAKDIEPAFRAAGKVRADAILWQVSGSLSGLYRTAAELAVKNRLPVIYERRSAMEAGGLLSYGVNLADLDRRAASYVVRILKGANPAVLPVE